MCVLCAHTRLCAGMDSALSVHTHTRTHTHSLSLSLSLCPWSSRIFGGEKAVCLSMCALGELVSRTDCGVSGVPKKRDDWDGGADPCWVWLQRNVVGGT